MTSNEHILDAPVAEEAPPAIAAPPSEPLPNIEATADDLPPSYESQVPAGTQAPFRAEDFVKDGKKHILLAASGSVACIKIPEIIRCLAPASDISIRLILTTAATHFFSGVSAENPSVDSLRQLPNVEGVYTDADEWSIPWVRGNAILHIELRKWADIMVVAPLDANTLAKMANGLSDNLLMSVLRAWDPEGKLNPAGRQGRFKYLIVAPAMNTAMWLHPATKKHIKVIEEEWAEAREFPKGPDHVMSAGTSKYTVSVKPWAKVLRPMQKELACGDTGVGAMMDWKDIVKEILYQVGKFH